MSSAIQQTAELLTSEITKERVRVWGIRSFLSILDQGLTSGAGFFLNLFLARWLTREDYGAFAVGFTSILFLFGFHSALLLEPMSVIGPARYSAQMDGYFVAHLKLHAMLVAVLSFLLLLGAVVVAWRGWQRELMLALIGGALALPAVLLLWLVRRMCYAIHRPSMAIWGSGVYFVCILVGLWFLHSDNLLSCFSAFLLMATASVPALLVLLWQLGVIGKELKQPVSWKQVWVENWGYGRWLVAGTVLFSVASQIQTYVVAALLGLGAAGTLRATQIPSLVMLQIVTAVGLMALPAMAQDFGIGQIDRLKKKAVLTAVSLTTIALGYCGILTILAAPLDHLLFGEKFYSQVWLIPVLGLVPVLAAFGTGFSMALRAVRKSHFDLVANAISAPIGFLTALIFIHYWGLTGAALSMVAGFGAYTLVFFFSFRRWAAAQSLVSGRRGELQA